MEWKTNFMEWKSCKHLAEGFPSILVITSAHTAISHSSLLLNIHSGCSLFYFYSNIWVDQKKTEYAKAIERSRNV